MSWDHGTYGFETFEELVKALPALGATSIVEHLSEESYVRGSDAYSDSTQALRTATFVTCQGLKQVIEEYLSVDDGDCDGSSRISVAIYPDGERPILYRLVYDGGHCRYPNTPGQGAGRGNTVRYCINTGTFEIRSVPEPIPEPTWIKI